MCVSRGCRFEYTNMPRYVQIEKVVELGYNFNINSLVSTSESGFIFNLVEANTMFLTVGMKRNPAVPCVRRLSAESCPLSASFSTVS